MDGPPNARPARSRRPFTGRWAGGIHIYSVPDVIGASLQPAVAPLRDIGAVLASTRTAAGRADLVVR
jgi:hypothetical protein